MSGRFCLPALLLAVLLFPNVSEAALIASYGFDHTLNSSVGGPQTLAATDPLGTSGYIADTVFGNARTVYAFNGNGSPVTDQAGLTFDNSPGLLSNDTYSIAMIVNLSASSGWRRLIDVENRQSDAGFYVDPSDNLAVYPITGSSKDYTPNVYHNVVLTDSAGTVKAYLDGALQFTTTTSIMDLQQVDNPGNLINFFLDNTSGGGQGEYSSGRVALINLYDTALTADEVRDQFGDPFPAAVPEPSSIALAGLGVLGLLASRRQRRS